MELKHLGKFDRGHYKKSFCEIILNLDQYFRGCRLKSLYIFNCGCHLSAEPNYLGNFGIGHYEEHFCETILNLDQI